MPPMSPFSRTFIAVAIGQTMVTQAVNAVTIEVNQTTDGGAGCTLREAIESVNEKSLEVGCSNTGSGFGSNDTVHFSAAINNLTINLTNGTILIKEDVIIHGPGEHLLAVHGDNTSPNSGVFHVSYASAYIDNLTIVGGTTGRGISTYESILDLAHVTITGSSTKNGGGGLIVDGDTAILKNCKITGNHADYNGGGIRVFAGYLGVFNSVISSNSTNKEGGGIQDISGSRLNIVSTLVSDNTALTYGGGILKGSGNTFTLTKSTVSGNSAIRGGGIYGERGVSITLTESTVSGNSAFAGGGINVNGTFSSNTVALINSTISANVANNLGGAIVDYQSNIFSLTNSTVSGNTAGQGGGIYTYFSSLKFINSIVSGNSDNDGDSEIYNDGSIITADNFNLFGDSSHNHETAFGDFTPGVTDINATSNGDLVSIHQPTMLPSILKPLARNGGSTKTHALIQSSPAVDAGNSVGCPTKDQRGEARDGMCDIGSFELVPSTCYVINGTGSKTIVFCL